MTKLSRQFGIRLSLFPRAAGKLPRFLGEFARYRRQNPEPPFQGSWARLNPYLHDYDAGAGATSGHYFNADLWAARKIYERRPPYHLDIGSRIDGFVAHLLTFMNDVRVIDVRPLESDTEGLSFVREDATELAGIPDRSVGSISSLHAAEHFGLGRYGDPVNPAADRKFMNALQRVLAPGGHLYFAVPVGRARLEFNAHRVYDPRDIRERFRSLELLSFAGVNDRGEMVKHCRPEDFVASRFACGFYEFTKSGS